MSVEFANFSCTHQTQTLYSFPVLIEIFILFSYFSKKEKKNLSFFYVFFLEFDFVTNNNTLYYNLSLSITFRKWTPTTGVSIYHQRVQAIAYYILSLGGNNCSLRPRYLSKFNAEKVMGFIALVCKALF